IQRLICHFELDFASLEQAHGIRMREYFADIWPHLQAMHEDGLLTLDDQGIQILPTGRLLVRTVCMLFDRYLEPAQASALKRACGHEPQSGPPARNTARRAARPLLQMKVPVWLCRFVWGNLATNRNLRKSHVRDQQASCATPGALQGLQSGSAVPAV